MAGRKRVYPNAETPIGTYVTVTRGGFLEDLDVVIKSHGVVDGRGYATVFEEYNGDEDDVWYDGLKITDEGVSE